MLRRDLAHDRVRHAYLFTGPAGIGKRSLATEFARALLCSGANPPCGQCRHCQLTARGNHADLLSVEPVTSGRSVRTAKIKIGPVRDLIHDLSLSPVEARRRVARLLRFDTANGEAMNAFLKTLEEPPGQAVILLTAERADDLLPTIVSRCQVLALRPLPFEAVRTALITRWLVPAEQADLLAHLAQGRLGWAVRMHADEAALAARRQRLDDLSTLLGASRVARFAYAEKLAKESASDHIQETLDLWLGFWRDVLLARAAGAHRSNRVTLAAGDAAPPANPDRAADITRLAQAVTPSTAANVIVGLRRTGALLEQNVNARLALEVCLLDWPRLPGLGHD